MWWSKKQKINEEEKNSENSKLICINNPKLNSQNISISLFEEYYKTNPIIFKCISFLAKSLLSINIKHDLNLNENWENFIQKIIINLLITGNCYIEKSTLNVIQNYSEIILLFNPNTQIIQKYKMLKHNKWLEFPAENIIHIKYSEYYPISPMEVAYKHIEGYNSVLNYIIALVQNGGRPSGILSLQGFQSKEIREKNRRALQEMYKTINSKGDVAIIEGDDYKWEQIGTSPEKLQIIELQLFFAKSICFSFNISPILVGLEDATHSNYEEIREEFLEDYVRPFLKSIINQLNFALKSNIVLLEKPLI